MKVMKFGGTSVGTAESLGNVKRIVESVQETCIVVVSALGGLTDRLIATAHKAASADMTYMEDMDSIEARHYEVVGRVLDEDVQDSARREIGRLLEELRRNYDGVALLRALPSHILDVIVSFGERMSSVIVSAMIKDSILLDSMRFIKTEEWFGRNIADSNLTTTLIMEEFAKQPFRIAVVPGFISTDRENGVITNLGRGGSDFTAALIAAALNADLLEIWTDVDGFMTADPRMIPTAFVQPHMTFIESMELCSFGAKVIYPPTIYPVFHKNIPIKILNTFNPSAPGTLITDVKGEQENIVKGISSIKGTTMIWVSGRITSNVAEINSRTFNALAKKGISVFMVSPPAERKYFSFAVADSDSAVAMKVLEEEFAPELADGKVEKITSQDNLATIAIVGDNIRQEKGLGARIINTVQRDGIEVVASSWGVSDTTITLVVSLDKLQRTMQLIHGLVFGC